MPRLQNVCWLRAVLSLTAASARKIHAASGSEKYLLELSPQPFMHVKESFVATCSASSWSLGRLPMNVPAHAVGPDAWSTYFFEDRFKAMANCF